MRLPRNLRTWFRAITRRPAPLQLARFICILPIITETVFQWPGMWYFWPVPAAGAKRDNFLFLSCGPA